MFPAILLLHLFQHAMEGSTPWKPLTGAKTVEYRTAQPFSDSCSIEFHNLDPSDALTLAAVATYVDRRLTAPVVDTGQAPTKSGPTVLKPHLNERTLRITLSRSGRYTAHLERCYGMKSVISTSHSPTPNESGSQPSADAAASGIRSQTGDASQKPK